MVNGVAWLSELSAVVSTEVHKAEEKAQPLLWQLDPRQRARVLMALLGVVLAGAALIAIAILGGRYTFRLAQKRFGPTDRVGEAWYRKPLASPGETNPPEDTTETNGSA